MNLARSVAILGSTGSVGASTLDLLTKARAHGSAAVEVVALAAGGNVARLIEQALARRPRFVALAPAAMSAANETAVAAFLDRRIGFLDIAATVAETLERMERTGDLRAEANANGVLETAMAADRSARRMASGVLAELETSF